MSSSNDTDTNDAPSVASLASLNYSDMPSSSATTTNATPTPHPPLQRTQTDPNLRSCFICLQTPAETPNAVWVNACPCSLEAHEACMLRWISEHERESTKTLRCPACKGKIQTTEPKDRFVGLRDRLHKVYSRMTPAILLGIVTGCSMAGSSYYGMLSMCVFAGPGPAMGWLGLGRALADRRMNPGIPWYRWKAGWEFCFRFWLLNFIAPALMIQKALPAQLVDMLTLPASVLYGASLVFRNDMPTWPPSPAWVLTMMPWVSFSYNRIYYDFCGAYERRLNKALRGRGPPNEEVPAAAVNEGGQQANAVADNPAAAEEDDEGYFAQALRVGNAVLNLLGDEDNEEVVAEIELQLGPGEDEQAVIQELQDELNDQGIVVVEDELAGDDRGQASESQSESEQAGQDQGAAGPPPPVRVEAEADNNQPVPNNNNNNNNDNQAQEEPIRERNGTSTTLTELVNGVVTALTFPLVCWGTGEVLRYTLPEHWLARPHPRVVTGLLQEQWGRSLIGGMVFVVARDMLNLYTKHRRVQVRKHRRVRNVPRRRPQQQQQGGS
ncbi:E3 ubiquitin-protein ligase MARCH5 [Cytospora mali]|uniref:E3 ubiquitin-protein ligase MARCH5 n=1 Tax=Cytospora mali TaxID=578113 RepID=A0A194UVZ3_CYTMA|nr:E3 ubiquitin-protein ligase MARCH5 [Valsa mali var. pyri (nom. inval.)]